MIRHTNGFSKNSLVKLSIRNIQAMSDRTGAPTSGLVFPPSDYHKVHRGETVDNLFGTEVADPYRWLEDVDSDETKQFVEDQNNVTDQVLAKCTTRAQFKELLTKLYDYPKFGVPSKHGDYYYSFYNQGLQNQFVLQSQASLDSTPNILLDPNTWSDDGTVTLASTKFSENGHYVGYLIGSGGSEWRKAKVGKVLSDGRLEQLDDTLDYIKYSGLAWTHDNAGFFYCRYAAPSKEDLGTEVEAATNMEVRYHVLGTQQSDDPLILCDPSSPKNMFGTEISDDGRYLIITTFQGTDPANKVYLCPLTELHKTPSGTIDFQKYDMQGSEDPKIPIQKLIDTFDDQYTYITNTDQTFVFQTNHQAPRYKLVEVDVDQEKASFQTLIDEHPEDLMEGVYPIAEDKLLVEYLSNVISKVQVHSLSDGRLVQSIEAPFPGSLVEVSAKRKLDFAFMKFTGYTEPGAIYKLDLAQPGPWSLQLHQKTQLADGIDLPAMETRQETVTSSDGTKINMFVFGRKGVLESGKQCPTILYGYGGFNVSLTPTFSVIRLCFLLGYHGQFAVANLRGGGEFGVQWRDAGSNHNKQNVFDDFQACAAYLSQKGYCSPSTLSIMGGSNGGLLVGACVNQRPDLQVCGIAQVGVMDMLRFHKFTIGYAWMTDYGDPDLKEDFEYIYNYSPLHNVKVPPNHPATYPAVMCITGDHDDLVVPLHTFKYIATLQHVLGGANSEQTNPLVARIEVRAGHGRGKPTSKIIEENADTYAFAAAAMGAEWKYGA